MGVVAFISSVANEALEEAARGLAPRRRRVGPAPAPLGRCPFSLRLVLRELSTAPHLLRRVPCQAPLLCLVCRGLSVKGFAISDRGDLLSLNVYFDRTLIRFSCRRAFYNQLSYIHSANSQSEGLESQNPGLLRTAGARAGRGREAAPVAASTAGAAGRPLGGSSGGGEVASLRAPFGRARLHPRSVDVSVGN